MQSTRLSLLYVICFLLLQVSTLASAKVKHYKWKIDYRFWSPDCVEKLVISINGQHPGPTIRARVGDTVVVELENLMFTEGVVVHWHGIRQKGTPWYDGTGGVAQCVINPGETFVYKFEVDKAGTYFYHGHYGLQRTAGLYGSLIVDLPRGMKEPFEYDGELSVILNDWWHMSVYDQSLGLVSNPFRWVGDPQSLLMNGRGRYDCSKDTGGAKTSNPTCNAGFEECAPLVLPVEPGKTYRLRIASVASLEALNFQIEGHSMKVVEADGNYVEEVELTNLNIYSGETYSVLVTAQLSHRRSFWITANIFGRQSQTAPALAVLALTSSGEAAPAAVLTPATLPPALPAPWNDTEFSVTQSRLFVSRKGYGVPPPPKADKQIILLNTQNQAEGTIKWAINNFSLVLPVTPILSALKFNLKRSFDFSPPPDSYSSHYDIYAPPQNPMTNLASRVYLLPFNSTIDFILQNANTLTPNNSEIHPWHMHGHDFWVLGHGIGAFDPARDPQSFNLKNPPLRNSVPVFPYGWTAVRFISDNPGAWLFHCHVESHFHMGMGIVFAEGIDRLGRPPRSTLGCGLTKRWLP